MKRLFCLPWLAAAAWAVGFAPDQRHLAPNSWPFTALGRTSAHGGLGCAVLIGPDLVLTCGHCISNPQRQVYDDVEIEFGLGFEASHKARLKQAFMLENASSSIEAGQDWAIVRIDRPLGAYYGWLQCRYLSDSEWQDAEVELLGYCKCPEEARPQFGDMDRPYRCPGAVSDVGPQILFHNCAMWGGTSGAPLLARTGERYSLVGLNFAGVTVENEVLQHGFRDTYRKDLANLAIPGRNWRETLESIPKSPPLEVKSLGVENRSKRPVRIKVEYQSLFEPPGSGTQTRVMSLPPGSQRVLLERSAGCADSEISVQKDDKKPVVMRLKGSENTLVIP
ncbi:trypsin-like peptidase domain-containing protein [bacterium]|nr:trypsin-like peptidase domain-containing protein [bacterium]